MAGSMHNSVKVQFRLDPDVHAIYEAEAKKENTTPVAVMLSALRERARQIDGNAMEMSDLKWGLVEDAMAMAKQLCRKQFTPDIIHRTIIALSENPDWMARYTKFLGDNPYKNGVERKGVINRELGYRIKEAIGGKVKLANGKAPKVWVTGSIIQSFTVLDGYDKKAVTE